MPKVQLKTESAQSVLMNGTSSHPRPNIGDPVPVSNLHEADDSQLLNCCRDNFFSCGFIALADRSGVLISRMCVQRVIESHAFTAAKLSSFNASHFIRHD